MKTGDERKLYRPFVQMANEALDDLRELDLEELGLPDLRSRRPEDQLMFHVSDRAPIRATHGYYGLKSVRMPDIVFLSTKAAVAAANPDKLPKTLRRLKRHTATTEPHKAFHWGAVAISLEFKRMKKKDSRRKTTMVGNVELVEAQTYSTRIDDSDDEADEPDPPSSPTANVRAARAARSGTASTQTRHPPCKLGTRRDVLQA